jgi:hypothetical protein
LAKISNRLILVFLNLVCILHASEQTEVNSFKSCPMSLSAQDAEGHRQSDLENSVERVELKLRVEDLDLMTVLCSRIPKKTTNVAVAILNSALPLPELRYLKRVRPDPDDGELNLVLLGDRESVDAMPAESMARLNSLGSELVEARVPSFPPR